MRFALILLLGFLLDCLFGDPAFLPHPVVAMGKLISALEKLLRARLPKTPGAERLAGGVMAALVLLVTAAATLTALWLARLLHPALGFLLEVFWCYQILAARCLADEGMRVYRALRTGSLEDAQAAVGRIVGRDTGGLTNQGVTKAAVETLAENACDGVVAPLFFLAIGGVTAGMLYKAINTMDSMVGYKNDRYRYFGTVAARLDDVANWLPARLTAGLMIVASAPLGLSARNSFLIWRRDRHNHKSPNAANPEAACAGALGVQLSGDAYYFGELYHKPTIGDSTRPIEPEDIARARKLLYGTTVLCVLLCCGLRLGIALLL